MNCMISARHTATDKPQKIQLPQVENKVHFWLSSRDEPTSEGFRVTSEVNFFMK